MTNEGVNTALAFVRSAWPHSNLGPLREAVVQWRDGLTFADDGEAAAALRRLRDSGREHAPSVGVVVRTVKAQRQGPPPSIEDAQRVLSRLMASCAPYGGSSASDTAEAIEKFAEKGVHEAVLRFVSERGIYAIRTMPDGFDHDLDPNQLADRRDLARHYRDTTLVGWRANPEPGLALDRARMAAGLNTGSLTGLARPDYLRALPSPDAA